MNHPSKHLWQWIVISTWLAGHAGPALAQEEPSVQDPTRPSAVVTDMLKAQLTGLQSILLRGLVLGTDGQGVAALQINEQAPLMVRSNSSFNAQVGGMALRIIVREVGLSGVTIEAPTLQESLLLASSSGRDMAEDATTMAAIRYLELHELPLRDVLRMLSDQSGLNYTASEEAGKMVVSLFLRRVSPAVVIEEICKSYNLWFRQDEASGITRVMTVREFERDLINFREEESEVFTLLYPNVQEVAIAIQNLFGDRVQLIMGQEDLADDSQDLQARFRRFNIINEKSSMSSILNGYSYNNGGAGGAGGTLFAGGNAITMLNGRNVSTATPANEFQNLTPELADRLQQALAAPGSTNQAFRAMQDVNRRPATIYVTVSRRNNMIVVRTGDQRAMADIRDLIRKLDVPTSLVLLEVKVLNLSLGDGFESVFDYQFDTIANIGHADNQLTGGFTQGDIEPPVDNTMMPGGTGLRSGDMTFQIVNDNFKARLQWLEQQNRVTIVATPILLTANNEVSRLFLGEERPIVRDISSQVVMTDNSAAVAPNTSFEYRPVGTTLLITPNINSDRTVTLRLLQENSDIDEAAASVPIVTSSGMVQNVSLDVVALRTISGTFVAKDGMAVAVGGLIEDVDSDTRAGVPFISRIPLLGFFFRRQQDQQTRQELVILVRPHVISTPSDGEKISKELLEKLMVRPELVTSQNSLDLFQDKDVRPKNKKRK